MARASRTFRELVKWGGDIDELGYGGWEIREDMIECGASIFTPDVPRELYTARRHVVMRVLAHPGLCEDLARMVAEMLV